LDIGRLFSSSSIPFHSLRNNKAMRNGFSFAFEFLSRIWNGLYTEEESRTLVDSANTTQELILSDGSGQTSTTIRVGEEQNEEEDAASDEERGDGPFWTRSDSSDSSSSSSCSFTEDEEVTEEVYRPAVVPPRRVSFHPHVEVREYSLTISDHPCCEDPYPVSLDWAHASPYLRYIDDSKIRGTTYNPGRRISGVEAKRRRLAAVRGCSEMDIDNMITVVPSASSPSSYELVPSSVGRSILSYISTLRLPTVSLLPARPWQRDGYLADADDDEYLLLYAGTPNATHDGGTGPAPSLEDLESGLY
jgi:hypothetical protein